MNFTYSNKIQNPQAKGTETPWVITFQYRIGEKRNSPDEARVVAAKSDGTFPLDRTFPSFSESTRFMNSRFNLGFMIFFLMTKELFSEIKNERISQKFWRKVSQTCLLLGLIKIPANVITVVSEIVVPVPDEMVSKVFRGEKVKSEDLKD